MISAYRNVNKHKNVSATITLIFYTNHLNILKTKTKQKQKNAILVYIQVFLLELFQLPLRPLKMILLQTVRFLVSRKCP